MARIAHVTILTLATAGWFGIAACSSSNDPASSNGQSGSTAVAASAGMANTTAGANAASTAGSGSVAGGSGGSDTGVAGSGTSGSPSAAGMSSAGAPSGSAGATGSAGSGASGSLSPLCSEVPVTAAGVAPAKGGACTATDSQLCYKTCGPQGSGFKSETCTAGAYAEQSGCTFPMENDYSCYKIPATPSAACPATAPQASMACSVAACTPCNAGGMYLDSTGTSKPGYCVCPASTTGASKWSCASTTAWPCPAGKGC